MSDEDKTARYLVSKPQKGGHELYYWQPSASLTRAGFKTVPLSRTAPGDQAGGGAQRQGRSVARRLPVFAKNTSWYASLDHRHVQAEPAMAEAATEHRCELRKPLPPHPALVCSARRSAHAHVTRRDAEQLWASLKIVRRRSTVGYRPLRTALELRARSRRGCGHAQPVPASRAAAPTLALTGLATGTDQRRGADGDQDGPPVDRAGGDHRHQHRAAAVRYLRAALVSVRRTHHRAHSDQDRQEPDHPGDRATEGRARQCVARPHEEQGDHARSGWPDRRRRYNPSRALPRLHFGRIFREVCRAAGIPETLQFRDLRRTATTQLAEAGCSLHEIASIGGWSVDTVAKMMAVYGKVNITMAENAIVKLEQYRSKQSLEG